MIGSEYYESLVEYDFGILAKESSVNELDSSIHFQTHGVVGVDYTPNW